MKKETNLREAQEQEQESALKEKVNPYLDFKHSPSSNEEILLSFKSESHEHYPKDIFWYVVAGIFTVLSVTYFIFEGSFTSAIVFVLIYSFVLIHGNTPAPIAEIHFTAEGVYKNKSFYKYQDINDFWIINSPKERIHALHLDIGKKIIQTITIQLHDIPDEVIRRIFEDRVKEDFKKEHPTHLKIRKFIGL